MAWDNVRKENIPFGNNRTVAKMRTQWLRRRGHVEERDANLHNMDEEDDDRNVMSHSLFESFKRTPASSSSSIDEDDEETGKDCWLKFVIFDILYLRGPDAMQLLKESSSPLDPGFEPTHFGQGSIINLDGYTRKFILYHLIEPQKNEVELVESVVVRPDGRFLPAKEYFTFTNCEYTQIPAVLDSISCMKNNVVSNLKEIDEKRRGNRTDEEIEQARAYALEKIYVAVVERQMQEGLIFKDLAAPYIFGDQSRLTKFWLKLKPDYTAAGHASDIDVAVLGALYATGLGRSGLLSHFIVGCVDGKSEGETKFLTMGKISGGGTKRQNLERLLEITGFRAATATSGVDYGKWFKMDRSVPDFISTRSFQRSMIGDNNGWTFSRDKYPDCE